MTFLKCIFGLVAGAICGFVAAMMAGLLLWIILGIAYQDSKKGDVVASSIVQWLIPAGALIGLAIPLVEYTKEQERQAARTKQEEDQRAAAAKRAEEELARRDDELRSQIASLAGKAKSLSRQLPNLVSETHRHLDQAEKEFEDGAFGPFWDAIELATQNLAKFYASLQSFSKEARTLKGIAKSRGIGRESLRTIVLRREDISGAEHIAEAADRMTSIVRVAQRNFQFASIYESRKLNKLVIGGFRTLAEAINGVGNRIDSSLKMLGQDMANQLQDVHIAQLAQLDAHNGSNEIMEDAFAEQREFAEEALEKLDNIQRRRIPKPPRLGDGSY